MKQKFLLLLFLLIAGTGTFEAKAQSMVIKTKDGIENIKQLSSLQNFAFFDNNLLLKYLSSSTESYSLSTINKLYFKDIPVGIENNTRIEGARTMSIYPNPVDHSIYIQNMPEGTSTVIIYRIDGVMVLHTQILSGNKSVNVSNLPNGLYLLKVNDQAFGFIKL